MTSKGGRIEVGEIAVRECAGGYCDGAGRGGASYAATCGLRRFVRGVGGAAEFFVEPSGDRGSEAPSDREIAGASRRQQDRAQFFVCDGGPSALARFAGNHRGVSGSDPAAERSQGSGGFVGGGAQGGAEARKSPSAGQVD